jgi:hypothetical protein
MRGYGLLGWHAKLVSNANDKHRKDNVYEIIGWLGGNWYQIVMVLEDSRYPREGCNSRICGEYDCSCKRTRIVSSTTRDNIKLVTPIDAELAQ